MIREKLERETGIEPATNRLGSRYSTVELLPLDSGRLPSHSFQDNVGPVQRRLSAGDCVPASLSVRFSFATDFSRTSLSQELPCLPLPQPPTKIPAALFSALV